MAKYRKTKTDNRMFLDIPKKDEDKEKIKRKYKKTTLELKKEELRIPRKK